MAAVKLYTNENITDLLSRTLRARGYDSVSVHEAHLRGVSDEVQLAYAASEGRAILSFNMRDFVSLHTDYLHNGKQHSGIIVSTEIPFTELLHRTLRLLEALSSEDLKNRLEWLNRYK